MQEKDVGILIRGNQKTQRDVHERTTVYNCSTITNVDYVLPSSQSLAWHAADCSANYHTSELKVHAIDCGAWIEYPFLSS
jgi:hypothetical protein